MSLVETKIEDIESSVRKLIKLHQSTVEENKKLISEVGELRNKLAAQEERIEELKEQNKITKLAKSYSGESENSQELKLKINELVREIDKCTALLNR